MILKTLIFSGVAIGALGLAAPAMALTPQEQYDQQMQAYQEQQQTYEVQRERYERHLEGYEYDRAHPHSWWRRAYFSAVPDWYYRYEGGELIGTEVAERDGNRVGTIGQVERAPDGHIDRIQVVLTSHRAVWLDVQHVRFNGADRIAFVDLPQDQLYDRSNYRP